MLPYLGDDDKWRMSVSAAVGIEATIAGGLCADSGTTMVYVQLPTCEGTEIADSDPPASSISAASTRGLASPGA